jgi:hypothetical protein
MALTLIDLTIWEQGAAMGKIYVNPYEIAQVIPLEGKYGNWTRIKTTAGVFDVNEGVALIRNKITEATA